MKIKSLFNLRILLLISVTMHYSNLNAQCDSIQKSYDKFDKKTKYTEYLYLVNTNYERISVNWQTSSDQKYVYLTFHWWHNLEALPKAIGEKYEENIFDWKEYMGDEGSYIHIIFEDGTDKKIYTANDNVPSVNLPSFIKIYLYKSGEVDKNSNENFQLLVTKKITSIRIYLNSFKSNDIDLTPKQKLDMYNTFGCFKNF
ncbi:MAG: hypothetical protein WAT43_09290 [Chitinophagales bacterium]